MLKKAAASEGARRTLRYVELLSDARTKLVVFFSILPKEGPMSEPHRESLRNVVLISSAGAGKTSLAEAILFAAGAIPHLGSIAQGTTVSDFEPEELHRRSSVSTSLLRCSWNHTYSIAASNVVTVCATLVASDGRRLKRAAMCGRTWAIGLYRRRIGY